MRLTTFPLFLLFLGCPKKEETPPKPQTQPPSNPILKTSKPESVGERLQQESSARRSGKPKAEEVLAGLEKAGLPLRNQRQHAASPVGALFCIGAESDHGLSLSVCEYADPEAARAGRESSLKAFHAIANREVLLNQSTTLTVLQSPPTAESEADAKRAAEAFSKL